jgi:hypothetical protein
MNKRVEAVSEFLAQAKQLRSYLGRRHYFFFLFASPYKYQSRAIALVTKSDWKIIKAINLLVNSRHAFSTI